MFDSTAGVNIELDVSMAHPWSKNEYPAEEVGWVPELRELKKLEIQQETRG